METLLLEITYFSSILLSVFWKHHSPDVVCFSYSMVNHLSSLPSCLHVLSSHTVLAKVVTWERWRQWQEMTRTCSQWTWSGLLGWATDGLLPEFCVCVCEWMYMSVRWKERKRQREGEEERERAISQREQYILDVSWWWRRLAMMRKGHHLLLTQVTMICLLKNTHMCQTYMISVAGWNTGN